MSDHIPTAMKEELEEDLSKVWSDACSSMGEGIEEGLDFFGNNAAVEDGRRHVGRRGDSDALWDVILRYGRGSRGSTLIGRWL